MFIGFMESPTTDLRMIGPKESAESIKDEMKNIEPDLLDDEFVIFTLHVCPGTETQHFATHFDGLLKLNHR